MGENTNNNKNKDEIRAGRKRAAATAGRNKRLRHREVLDQRFGGFQETKSSTTPLLLQTRRNSNHKFLFCNDQKRDIPSPGRITTRQRSKHRERDRETERQEKRRERELEQGASDVESEKGDNGASGSRRPRERSCPLKKKLLPTRTSLPCPIHATGLGPVRPDPTRCQATTDLLALQIGTPSLPKIFQK
jgi:hypothetical protein